MCVFEPDRTLTVRASRIMCKTKTFLFRVLRICSAPQNEKKKKINNTQHAYSVR